MDEVRPTAWTVNRLAGDWKVNPKQVYALIQRGEIAAVRVGKHYMIPDAEVHRFLGTAVTSAA